MKSSLMRTANGVRASSGRSGAVFDELERRFASGSYRFDEVISPGALAGEFGVSLQPIRAALTQLKTLGYVVIVPQVECRVASPSPREISDFFTVYGRMEGSIAALAAERHNAAQLRELEDVSRQLAALPTPRPGLPDRYAGLVGEWHSVVREMSDSPAIASRARSFWNMADFLLFQGSPTLPTESIRRANEQREEIAAALTERDASLAERLMYEHMKGKPVRVGITARQRTANSADMETSAV